MRNISSPISTKHTWAEFRGISARWSALGALCAAGTLWIVSAAETAKTHTVVMEGMNFSPATLRIRPGGRVAFKNTDLVPHTATATDAKTFDSGEIKPGESWSVIPPAGRTSYTCKYHPMMRGEIVVEAP
jgi:plastocyanin